MKVSFSINVYEGNYQKVLLDGFLKQQLDIIDYDFCDKNITLTDISDKEYIINIIKSEFPNFKIYDTSCNQEEVLNYFNLKIEDIQPSYYSIQYFNQIYNNISDYHFHTTSDCSLIQYDKKFINDAIDVMEYDNRIISGMPSWNSRFQDRKNESIFSIGDFFAEEGFTDQIHLIKMSEFKKDIYHYKHQKSDRYPAYGGECFEKRIDSYMNTFNKYRIVHNKSYYIHGN